MDPFAGASPDVLAGVRATIFAAVIGVVGSVIGGFVGGWLSERATRRATDAAIAASQQERQRAANEQRVAAFVALLGDFIINTSLTLPDGWRANFYVAGIRVWLPMASDGISIATPHYSSLPIGCLSAIMAASAAVSRYNAATQTYIDNIGTSLGTQMDLHLQELADRAIYLQEKAKKLLTSYLATLDLDPTWLSEERGGKIPEAS
jgi:Na+/glutamate symporter